jgi:hypothetical protein
MVEGLKQAERDCWTLLPWYLLFWLFDRTDEPVADCPMLEGVSLASFLMYRQHYQDSEARGNCLAILRGERNLRCSVSLALFSISLVMYKNKSKPSG